jgi:hypothetical protein
MEEFQVKINLFPFCFNGKPKKKEPEPELCEGTRTGTGALSRSHGSATLLGRVFIDDRWTKSKANGASPRHHSPAPSPPTPLNSLICRTVRKTA